MSRFFDGNASNYLQYDTTQLVTGNVTMSCWFYCFSNNGTNRTFLACDNILNNMNVVYANNTNFVAMAYNGSTIETGSVILTNMYNKWYHVCARFGSTTNIVIDGFRTGSDTGLSVSGMTITRVGMSSNFGAPNSPIGLISEAAMWNVLLTDGEIQLLSSGHNTNQIRTNSLIAYWPMNNREKELDRKLTGVKYDLSVVGTVPTVTNEPNMIIIPKKKFYSFTPTIVTTRRLIRIFPINREHQLILN